MAPSAATKNSIFADRLSGHAPSGGGYLLDPVLQEREVRLKFAALLSGERLAARPSRLVGGGASEYAVADAFGVDMRDLARLGRLALLLGGLLFLVLLPRD